MNVFFAAVVKAFLEPEKYIKVAIALPFQVQVNFNTKLPQRFCRRTFKTKRQSLVLVYFLETLFSHSDTLEHSNETLIKTVSEIVLAQALIACPSRIEFHIIVLPISRISCMR